MRDKDYKLVSLTNIQNELEEREMEAWHNLIRVLTHEIMNSVTPIVSLSSTAGSLLDGFDATLKNGMGDTGHGERNQEATKFADSPYSMLPVPCSVMEDVKGALDTISRRSQGLLHFVDDYRNLTRMPTPNFQTVKVAELFARVRKLLSDRLQVRNIKFTTTVEPPDLELTADPDLVEQVIINLIANSLTALSKTPSPKLTLTGKTDGRSSTLVQVTDNGQGIPEDLQEKIFIPFFTTHKEGSGIGLSLSRQIMRAHKGSITVGSVPNVETVFTLRF
ncbi:MAG: HAMP domain-containing histidine kinase [Bacteroidetes bacterium]|nr:HAMP domain-containing histidine kinase [Bacteroidota bacterium]